MLREGTMIGFRGEKVRKKTRVRKRERRGEMSKEREKLGLERTTG